MKKIIALFILLTGLVSAQGFITENFTETINATNDTLTFTINVEDAFQLEYFAECNDSLNLLMTSYYGGSGTKELSVADSLVTTSNTGSASAKVLRGYGASGIINLIPGATRLRIYCIRRTGSGVSTLFTLTTKKFVY